MSLALHDDDFTRYQFSNGSDKLIVRKKLFSTRNVDNLSIYCLASLYLIIIYHVKLSPKINSTSIVRTSFLSDFYVIFFYSTEEIDNKFYGYFFGWFLKYNYILIQIQFFHCIRFIFKNAIARSYDFLSTGLKS